MDLTGESFIVYQCVFCTVMSSTYTRNFVIECKQSMIILLCNNISGIVAIVMMRKTPRMLEKLKT